ncbi:MAG: ATP-binding protein [Pseudomonadales bacterium]|nr:ATP-binding protein [Pseudomonadales bacterium]
MALIHLIEGPIGAGKSTYARALGDRLGAPYFCLDEWIARLFIPDRPPGADAAWYLARKDRCVEQICDVALAVLRAGKDVVLELGLLRSADRASLYEWADEAGFEVRVYVLDAPLHIRRERIRLRNLERGPTWSVDVTEEMFERSSGWWEPPDDTEYATRTILDIEQA